MGIKIKKKSQVTLPSPANIA